MKLCVQQMSKADIYSDRVRIHASHRRGIRGGSICRIRRGLRFTFVEVRNAEGNQTETIFADDATRRRLKIKSGQSYNFSIHRVGMIGEFIWFSRASNPVNRVAGKMGLLSLWLGALSLALAIPPFWDWIVTKDILAQVSRAIQSLYYFFL